MSEGGWAAGGPNATTIAGKCATLARIIKYNYARPTATKRQETVIGNDI